ncbi:hypothetical protein G6F22_016892 [Rhizopus arrhizus]|nr:hypothetical protein G6F22_016892 [Rhizopus arrhizus]
MVAVDPAVARPGVGVDAQIVAAATGVASQLLVQSRRDLTAVERAPPELAVVEGVALGQLGHVVDRAADRACAEQEGRGAADGLDAIVDPAVHRTPGNRPR